MTPETQAWSEHWQRTLVGSIDLHAEDPVASALREQWARHLHRLKACEQIVDVGSGPAILARLVERLGWSIQAPQAWWCLDQAQLGQAWQHALPSGVRIREQTPFQLAQPEQGPVDALVSNFGLEYLDLQALAQALPRWLKPQAQLRAVLHAKDSVIDAASTEHIADLQLALQELQLPQRAQALAQAMATAPLDSMARMMHGVEVRDAYNEAVDRLKQVMEARGRASAVLMDLLRGITNSLRDVGRIGAKEPIQRIQSQASAYQAELSRLRQMQASALDEKKAQAWRDTLGAAVPGGRALTLSPVECHLGRVAWNLSSAD
jgi:hypothetical protein